MSRMRSDGVFNSITTSSLNTSGVQLNYQPVAVQTTLTSGSTDPVSFAFPDVPGFYLTTATWEPLTATNTNNGAPTIDTIAAIIQVTGATGQSPTTTYTANLVTRATATIDINGVTVTPSTTGSALVLTPGTSLTSKYQLTVTMRKL